jgi:hypothetical protein
MTPSPRSFLRFVLIGLALPCLLAPIGVCYQALRITGEPLRFISQAKLAISTSSGKSLSPEAVSELIDRVEGFDLRRHALERTRALSPEVKECDIDIRATFVPDSGSLHLSSSSSEPKFSRAYLDALVDQLNVEGSTKRAATADSANKEDYGTQVVERASAAIQSVQPWAPAIVLGAVVPFVLGLIAVLVAGRIWVLTGSRATGPPPVPKEPV